MQEGKDHFRVEEEELIKGECQEFISEKEKQWRSVDRYEQHPYLRVAAHSRNIAYAPHNVRTFPTLKRVLQYLIDTIFPLLFRQTVPPQEKERIALFLQQRLIAIRCQYFVQGIVCPKELLKLLRCFVVVRIINGIRGSSALTGIELLVGENSRKIMETSFRQQYRQALKYTVVYSRKKELPKILVDHPLVLEDQELNRLLLMKLKIDSNNYHTFYQAIEEEEPIIRCLLWLQVEIFKQQFFNIVKKAFGEIPKPWIYRRLCLSHAKEEGWISLKQHPDLLQLQGIGYEAWMSLQTISCLLA